MLPTRPAFRRQPETRANMNARSQGKRHSAHPFRLSAEPAQPYPNDVKLGCVKARYVGEALNTVG
nr:hypothetical protein [uncultured Kingella sp.]